MTAISNNDIARAIYLVLKDDVSASGEKKSAKYEKVVNFLFRRRLLSKTTDILLRLGKIINQEEGRIVAKISSVEALNRQTKTQLEHALKKRYSAKEIVLEENIDASLMGGIKIEANNEVIDLSTKNKIGKLQEYLTK